MGLLDKLKGELIDIIEWIEDDTETIAYRFERYGNEIKNGGQLTVREGQVAAFVNEGQLADVFTPGRYELRTANLPILSTLKGWKHGFESPFKAEVIFISSRSITGFGWGTPAPMNFRDPEFGMLQVRARGHFDFHVEDVAKFLRKVVGTDGEFTREEIHGRIRQKLIPEVITAMKTSGQRWHDLENNAAGMSALFKEKLDPKLLELYGILLDDFMLEGVDLTDQSRAKLEKRDDLTYMGQHVGTYERMQRADAMRAMADNPGAGGLAAGGMGMGMGMAMANQMGGAMNPMMGMGMGPGMMGGAMAAQAAPPPPPAGFYVLVNGQQQGPVPVQQLAQMAQQGQFTADVQVWKQGMAAWAPAGQVPELAQLFQTAAPPPPPQAAPPAPPAPPAAPPTPDSEG